MLAAVLDEIGAGVPATVLMSMECAAHVRSLCDGANLRQQPDAWNLLLREAPVIAELVINSNLYAHRICSIASSLVYAWPLTSMHRPLVKCMLPTVTRCLSGRVLYYERWRRRQLWTTQLHLSTTPPSLASQRLIASFQAYVRRSVLRHSIVGRYLTHT